MQVEGLAEQVGLVNRAVAVVQGTLVELVWVA
jgi:hypothetical protein